MEAETTKQIARRVRELRTRLGWTAADLGQRMTEQGIRWDRSIVANLESGKRQNVTVNELLALARVLHVAPVHLLVPISDDGMVYVTPNDPWPASQARAWVRGERALPETDKRIFYTEVPLEELGRS